MKPVSRDRMKKQLQPSDFPLRKPHPDSFTRHLYLSKPDSSLTCFVHDIPPHISGPAPPNLKYAKQIARDVPPVFKIKQKSRLSRVFTCVESTGTQVAQITGKLLAFGHWQLSLPSGSVHSDHDIEVRPVGMSSRADVFVKDSVPYFWDLEATNWTLSKVVESQRFVVAQLIQNHSRDREGILVIDGDQIDVLVALMTSLTVLRRNESFRAY